MASPWTEERVLALAPDSSSASAGQGLASTRKWSGLGRSERAVWGLCQGSGKDPYQARVDLSEPAFKCSCPSRKFPCKHGIALLLLLVKDEKLFKTAAEPGWVSEWMAGRSERTEKKAERAKAAPEKPVDAEAQARRAAERTSRVQDGVRECRDWIEDLIRRGLAAAQSEPTSSWERVAARMVDAQAPGLARMIREAAASVSSGEGWQARTLDRLGRLNLLLRAAERLEHLPASLAGDARVALGWTQKKEEALAGEAVADRWCILGQAVEDEDRIRVRRSWAAGRNTGRRALLLEFAAGPQPFDTGVVAGTEFDGELAFYPAGVALRAVVKARGPETLAFTGAVAVGGSVEAELRGYAEALARNPWLERWPVLLRATVARSGDRWHAWDSAGAGLPLRPGFGAAWKLLSIAGGRPAPMLAEWDGEFLSPLAVWDAAGPNLFEDLSPRWAA
jgi:hypothetical protein